MLRCSPHTRRLPWAEFIACASSMPALAAFEQRRRARSPGRLCLRSCLVGEPFAWRTEARPNAHALQWFEVNEPRAGRDHWFRAAQAIALAMMRRVRRGPGDSRRHAGRTGRAGRRNHPGNADRYRVCHGRAPGRRPRGSRRIRRGGLSAARGAGRRRFPLVCGSDARRSALRRRSHRRRCLLGRAIGRARRERRCLSAGCLADTHARVLATRGDLVEAEVVAREAVAVAEATDWLVGQGDAQLRSPTCSSSGARRPRRPRRSIRRSSDTCARATSSRHVG